MKRLFRITKIVFKSKYGLLKSVHQKIVINGLYNKLISRQDLSTHITPKEFGDEMAGNGLGLYEVGVFGNRMLNIVLKFNRIPKAKIKHGNPNFIKPLLPAGAVYLAGF
jgi:hypothetical protein